MRCVWEAGRVGLCRRTFALALCFLSEPMRSSPLQMAHHASMESAGFLLPVFDVAAHASL